MAETYPPVGAILLLRRVLPSTKSVDLYRQIEDWYNPNPAVRTRARYTPADSTNQVEFALPADTLVDAWCVDAGTAPFTESRVFHRYLGLDPTGQVDYVLVDNVAVCQRVCLLTASATASAIANGQGDITVTTANAVGTVLFSLDGFQTAGLPATTASTVPPGRVFRGLPPGTYTVTVRETRVGPCTATATVSLVVAYGPRYELSFRDRANVLHRKRIYEREYTGPIDVLPNGQPDPVVLDWPGGALDHVFTSLLRGSEAALALLQFRPNQFLPLFSGDERLHRVEVERQPPGTATWALLWKGWLLPEQYDAPLLADPNPVELAATDGLGTLDDIPFEGAGGVALRGDMPLHTLLLFVLGKLALDLPLHVLLNLYPSTATAGTPAIEQITFDLAPLRDTAKNTPWGCGRVLAELLKSFQCRLYQQDGGWWLERLDELTTGPLVYAVYAPDGTALAAVTRTLLASVTGPTTATYPQWREAAQRQQIRPAVARVRIEAEPGDPVNLLAFALPRPEHAPGTVPPGWSASVVTGTPDSALIYQGPTKAPILRLYGKAVSVANAANAAWVMTPPTSPVPGGTQDGGAGDAAGGFVLVRFRAKPYGNRLDQLEANQARLLVAVRVDGIWRNSIGMQSATVPQYNTLYFPDAKEQLYDLGAGPGAGVTTRRRIEVRILASVGGGQSVTVDITDLQIVWVNANVGRIDSFELDDRYPTIYKAETTQLVSRVDESLKLFHADTPVVRREGTPLDTLGRPVQGWFEPNAPGQRRLLGDYLVRDRHRLQRAPAQALTGVLAGPFAGPAALLTDPTEPTAAVYALTTAALRVASAEWDIGAVQVIGLIPPGAPLPANAIYYDDLTAWQDEDGRILTYDG